ncbi:MAG: cysteine synthase family protein [Chloroflexi bacterium]|nr:cysteine synthase family protein [Chloroflexota bacterium]MDA1218458.1 cysteine synthase family protein [Chloroflexota bacterium]PKB56839.1 MAG: cysteine synthase B [SAR202 cluster bacterium Casp-Chloro-G3]
MVTKLTYKGILDTIGNTPMVELQKMSPRAGVRIFAKLEGQNPTGSVKDRIAQKMIERAEQDGEITANRSILEPTSGNTGIALAMIARIKGYKVTVVMPENVSAERTQLLQAYGANIIYSDGTLGTNGSIEMARDVMEKHPHDYLMMYQYGNEGNPEAHYQGTGREIIEALPDVDMFVAGLGTGGTLMGTGRRLKEHNPNVKIVAVAPEPDDFISGLRRLEDGFIPPILDLNLLDARIMVGSFHAFRTTRDLLEQEGIFAGVSSGSVVYAALRQAERMEQGNIVCLLADGGWKYLSTSLWTKDYEQLEKDAKGKIWW